MTANLALMMKRNQKVLDLNMRKQEGQFSITHAHDYYLTFVPQQKVAIVRRV